MHLDQLNKWMSLVANLGVIAGIVFLAVEIRQNSDELSAQSRFNYYQQRAATMDSFVTDDRTLEAMFNLAQGKEIPPLETFRLAGRVSAIMTNWEYEFAEYQAGNITLAQFNIIGKRNAIVSLGALGVNIWMNYRETAPLEFVQFMEEEVLKDLL